MEGVATANMEKKILYNDIDLMDKEIEVSKELVSKLGDILTPVRLIIPSCEKDEGKTELPARSDMACRLLNHRKALSNLNKSLSYIIDSLEL